MKPAVCFAVFAGIPFVIAAGPPGRLIIIIFVPTLPVLLGDTNYTNYSLRYRHQERSAGSRPRVFCGRSRGRQRILLFDETASIRKGYVTQLSATLTRPRAILRFRLQGPLERLMNPIYGRKVVLDMFRLSS